MCCDARPSALGIRQHLVLTRPFNPAALDMVISAKRVWAGVWLAGTLDHLFNKIAKRRVLAGGDFRG